MAHYYTADLHLGHAAIIGMCGRPFDTVEAMDRALVEAIRQRVGPKDDLWVIGDLAMAKAPDRPRIAEMFSSLPGRKHLVEGNHDVKARWVRDLPWASIQPMTEVRDGGQRVVLCHYPMLTWPGIRHGALQLFGHVHDNWAGSRGCVNVGVDQWGFRPVTIDEIRVRSESLPWNCHVDQLEPGLRQPDPARGSMEVDPDLAAPDRMFVAPGAHGTWAEAFAGDWPSPGNPQDTPYVREDIHAAVVAERDALRDETDRLREALQFYGCDCDDGSRCRPIERDRPSCGWKARAALTAPSPAPGPRHD